MSTSSWNRAGWWVACVLACACQDDAATGGSGVREGGGTYTPPGFGIIGITPTIVTPEVIITPAALTGTAPDADVMDADVMDADVPDPDVPDAEAPDVDVPDAQVEETCGNGDLEDDETCDYAADACCNATCDGPAADRSACDNDRGECWSGVCCPGATQGTGGPCSFDDGENIVFVSSDSSNGALPGLAAADARCDALAGAANLAGTYHAWLSIGAAAPLHARDRVGQGPYLRIDGAEISPNLDSLLRAGPSVPINMTERGVTRSTAVWTGTSSLGAFTGNACGNWTVGTSTPIGTVGESSMTSAGWTQSASPTCDTSAALYCIQDDCPGLPVVDFRSNNNHCGACANACPAQLTCIEGECAAYAFVTSVGTTGTIANGGDVGLAGADSFCNERAERGGVPGTFVAWLSSAAVPAHTRLVDAPYYRLDNQPIATGIAHLRNTANVPLLNPINITESGNVSTAPAVWTGTSATGGSIGGSMCLTDWTDALRASPGTYGLPTATDATWTTAGTMLCSGTAALYCFQVLR